MSLDFSRTRLPLFKHQKEDVAWLLARPFAFICSEMRTGKTAIVITAAQFLFEARVIDKVIVVAPAPVRDVWYDPVLGELAKHFWLDLPATVTEFHARLRTWVHDTENSNGKRLDWFVTNYEFLRSKNRLTQLLSVCGPKTLLVLDESAFVKNHAAQQTRACLQLRRACGRVVLLNGTPIFHSPMDLFSQGNILHPSILDCKFVTHYRARYAVQRPVLGSGGRPLVNPRGGGSIMQTVGWTNLDDLQRRFAPFTVRRLQKECLDLPPKLDPVMLTATLTPETWRAYRDMRDELVVWLRDGTVATGATAAVKALRLSQITGGFLGGVEDANIGDWEGANPEGYDGVKEDLVKMIDRMQQKPQYTAKDLEQAKANAIMESMLVNGIGHRASDKIPLGITSSSQEVGREKLDVLLWFLGQRLEAEPTPKVVAWTRFRAEAFRALKAVQAAYPQFRTAVILGGQKRVERLEALALLKPETSPDAPVFVVGIEGTGSFGLDMAASHTCVTLSGGYSPGRTAQTLDRVYGPGQQHPIAYYDVVAVGPKGQRTIDHDIIAARRSGEDVAQRTATAWVKQLTEE
jgi:hypothetical protein